MFLKSNTKAFIHATHFLFTILDAKECKKRFYWPIFDKNAETSYRTSVVEYVNHLIDRQKLKMNKIKMHIVVVPAGIKFMEFLLALINLVIREDLERGNGRKDVSIDLDEAMKSQQAIIAVSKQVIPAVKEGIAQIEEKNRKLDEFLSEIFTNVQEDYPRFLAIWHELNKYQKSEIDQRNSNMEAAIRKCSQLFKKVNGLLDQRVPEISYRTIDLTNLLIFLKNQFPELYGFQENLVVHERLSFTGLLKILEIALPQISIFMSLNNFSRNEALKYEIREVTKLCKQSNEVSTQIAAFSRKYFAKSDPIPELDDEVFRLPRETQLKPYLLGSPKIILDCSENNAIVSKKSRLPLIETGESPLRRAKLFRIHQLAKTPKASRNGSFHGSPSAKKSSSKKEKENDEEAGNRTIFDGKVPPKRPKFNAKDIFGKVTNVNRQRPTGNGNLGSMPLSSTMLSSSSPDRRLANISGISSISRITSEPSPIQDPKLDPRASKNQMKTLWESPLTSKQQQHVLYQASAAVSPSGVVFNERSCHLARNEFGMLSAEKKLKTVQMSPSGKFETLVFKSSVPVPKIVLNDASFSLDQVSSF
jgi:HAUS augmin-like complex subunit 6